MSSIYQPVWRKIRTASLFTKRYVITFDVTNSKIIITYFRSKKLEQRRCLCLGWVDPFFSQLATTFSGQISDERQGCVSHVSADVLQQSSSWWQTFISRLPDKTCQGCQQCQEHLKGHCCVHTISPISYRCNICNKRPFCLSCIIFTLIVLTQYHILLSFNEH